MISVDNDKLEFSGCGTELLAELTIIMRGMLDDGVANKELLSIAVEMAFMDDEEISEKRRKLRESIALVSILFGDLSK